LLSDIEQSRLDISGTADPKRKSQFGQFFTPAKIAQFMAGMFTQGVSTNCRLLDAGAGIGSLSAAFLDRWVSGGFHFHHLELDAFEIDKSLLPHLASTLDRYKVTGFIPNIRNIDFVLAAANNLSGSMFAEKLPKYTHAILNPPYKKLRSDSEHRAALRLGDIETVNLYSAFTALALSLLDERGQLVAIIPRSFCNGPYYRPFRDFVLTRAAIQHIHLFASRNKAFKDDDVLQENIIIRLERSASQGPVIVSTSTDASFSDLVVREYPFGHVVAPTDAERFIHIPTSPEKAAFNLSSSIRYSLTDLGITVSTGPVVDFRVREYLREMPVPGSVPLLYPCHFNGPDITWPRMGVKKPNAIIRNSSTEKWLYPNGFYCVVRRFSSKEEKRRITASVAIPSGFEDSSMLGFENHLNVFHESKHGLPQELAYGLAVFLNSTAVDQHFRRFNGHTQVNATDLKHMKYPSRDAIIELGKWGMGQPELSQAIIDSKLGTFVE